MIGEDIPQHLQITTDMFNAIHLKATPLLEQQPFCHYLQRLLQHEQQNQKTQTSKQTTAIWVHLTAVNFSLAAYLTQELKFKLHHGLAEDLILYRWISQLEDLVPPYSMFIVACGAVIVKDGCVLVVQEKSGGRAGMYGIPGGRADFGETIPQCVERELYEETHIRAKFDYILYFRETDKTVYNASDLYFVCMMKYQPEALEQLELCQRQLSDYKWVPLSQYGEFSKQFGKSTQEAVGQYLCSLQKQGYDFDSRHPNRTKESVYISARDKIPRTNIEHLLIEQP